MHKSPVTSVLVIIAMILVIISRIKNGSIDALGYAAIAVLLANVLKLIFIDKKPK